MSGLSQAEIAAALGRAKQLRNEGRLHEAIALLQQTRDIFPENPGIHIELARTFRSEGNPDAALAALERALTINPTHVQALLDSAVIMHELGRSDEAAQRLETIIARVPAHFTASLELGRIRRRQRRFAESLTFFQTALQANPDHVGAKIATAAVLRELGRLDEAATLLDEALAAKPGHFPALMEIAQVRRRQGDCDAALAALTAACDIEPANEHVWRDRAAVLRELGRMNEAEKILRGVVAHAPTDATALTMLGEILRGRGDRLGALSAYEAAAVAKPDDMNLPLRIAATLRELGRYDEAEQHLRTILTADPHHIAALNHLGALRLERFDLTAAEEFHRRALAVDPRHSAGYLGLGYTARRRHDHATALAAFRQALDCPGSGTSVVSEIATELRELGRYTEAEQLLAIHFAAETNSFARAMQAGRLHRQRGERQEAAAVFMAAQAGHPPEVAPLSEAAIELRALGRPQESEALLQRELARDPTLLSPLLQLAEHNFQAEAFDEAWTYAMRAIETHGFKFTPYLIASRIAVELGDTPLAWTLLNDAISRTGPHPEIDAAKVALLLRRRDWHAARAIIEERQDRLVYSCLWAPLVRIAIDLGEHDEAERILSAIAPQSITDRAQALVLRGLLAEARWQLAEAVATLRVALALSPNANEAHAALARVALKQFDLPTCRVHLRRMTEVQRTTTILQGRSLNMSQTHIGQMIDEFILDQNVCQRLVAAQTLPPAERVPLLATLVRDHPDHTGVTIAMLVALREMGSLAVMRGPAAALGAPAIPRRIVQYWNDSDPPDEIVDLMDEWRDTHTDFIYQRLDDEAAAHFLKERHGDKVLRAFHRAREPAQKADLLRLADLDTNGGFYIDADDRCLRHLNTLVPRDAAFVAYQEPYGTLGNSFLGATPRHPIIAQALDSAVEAINRGDTDLLWLSTGPGLLSRAFCQVVTDPERGADTRWGPIFDIGDVQHCVGRACVVSHKRSIRMRTPFGGTVSNGARSTDRAT